MPSSLSEQLLAGSAVFTLLALNFTLVLMDRVLERCRSPSRARYCSSSSS